jgi:hypothetical protein
VRGVRGPIRNGRSTLLPLPPAFQNLAVLLDESAGGIQITGDSGSGKSCVMELMMQLLTRRPAWAGLPDLGWALIDPHGDLSLAAEAHLAGLPASTQRRVVIVHPADTTRKLPGFNPLAVPAAGLDELTWRARVITKCSHTARILLHAWGERDFNGKPLLLKYTSWFLETLGLAGLTLPEVRHFFDPSSPVYGPLTQFAPDAIARLELGALAELRYRDREEFIASTKNRFLGLLKNPLVELGLGKIDETLDVRQLIQEGAIVLINLEPGGVLRREDREILANAWLSEFIFAVYNTPPHLRKAFALFVDELPLFEASAGLIRENVTQLRKFKLHFVAAHAGAQFFEGGVQNPLLNALTGACRVHIIFRHQHEADATYFGRLVNLPQFSATRTKHTQTVPMQFQDGHDLVTLTDTAETWGEADQQGGADADGSTDTATRTQGTNDGTTRTSGETFDEHGLRRAASEARAATTGSSTSIAHTVGQSRSRTASWSLTSSRGGSRTFKQQLVPRIVVRDIVTSIQFYSPDEQVMEWAGTIAAAPVGTALLYIAGQGTVKVRFPLPSTPFRRTPKFGAKQLARLRRLVTDRPEYALPQEIASLRATFTAELAGRLTALAEAARNSSGAATDVVSPDGAVIVQPSPLPI